ncbi:MAG: CRISPR-associated endonuclease Cas1 [Proteobacteria bacterium]|nr:CRISPR-associated endonuclease Cas1 [Pseudomonadota bacterium]MBS0461277.1 CRISPR-associated endonuclease Cas1 [Pseudomonadota bacterium]MBS0465442.1 CRISPR-associated endonuclease Cas1 [Pseudomonadota bacterium]
MTYLLCAIDRRDSALEFAAGVLTVRAPEHKPWKVGARQLGLVVVHGHVAADAGVWRGLADAGVAVALTGGRNGQDVAWVAAGLSANGELRHRQHQVYADPYRRLVMARWVLDQKIAAIGTEMEADPALDVPDLRFSRYRAEKSVPLCHGIGALEGIEGALAAEWFGQLRARIDPAWGFTARNRRPPRDPCNALLSYGYALALADALTAVQRLGLDPALGFLHSLYPGRYALALDALECVRALVDRVAVQLLAPGRLTAKDFSNDPIRGCRLSKHARDELIREWNGVRRVPAVSVSGPVAACGQEVQLRSGALCLALAGVTDCPTTGPVRKPRTGH